MLLKLKNYHHSYSESVLTLENINFDLKKGEIVAILGNSGSGKSTLLLSMAGLLEPFSGEILFKNKKILKPSEKLIAGHSDIKIVKQDYGLFPNMTVAENIAYELRYYEEDYRKSKIDSLLDLCEISEIKTKLPRHISGGQQQRTAIARAIAENPDVLLLDEPFSHLDLQNKTKLKTILQKIIKRNQIGCAFVTHEVEDAISLANKLIILEKGKIIQIGKPEYIYNQPINEYTARLTGLVNIIKKGKKTSLIRPENLKICNAKEANYQGQIINVSFIGRGFLIDIKTKKNEVIQFFTLEKPIQVEIFLSIKFEHEFI